MHFVGIWLAREMGQGLTGQGQIGQGQSSQGQSSQDQIGLGQIGQGKLILGLIGLDRHTRAKKAMAKCFRATWTRAKGAKAK